MQSAQLQKTLSEQAAAWVVRLNGDPSEVDRETFSKWRAQSDDHARAYEEAASTWDAVAEYAASPKLLAMRRTALERTGRYSRRWNRRAVAAVLAFVVIVPLVALFGYWRQLPVEQHYETGRAEQRVIVLEDGSRLSLDAMTRVEVVYRHDERHISLLAGRANFEVERDLARPMNVRAGPRTVTALGTVFTVERAPHEVVVTLVEGRVAVTSNVRTAGVIEMKPLQQLLMKDSGEVTTRSGLDPLQALAWRDGKLVFNDDALGDVVARMNNYLPIPLVAEGPARELRISGVFKAGDTRAFVNAMEELFPLVATRRHDAISLRIRENNAAR